MGRFQASVDRTRRHASLPEIQDQLRVTLSRSKQKKLVSLRLQGFAVLRACQLGEKDIHWAAWPK